VVHVHDDSFPSATPDDVWLREVGRSGWLVLTKDQRIRYREIEKQAVLRAGVGVFVLTGGNMSGKAMASAFVRGRSRSSAILIVSATNARSTPRSSRVNLGRGRRTGTPGKQGRSRAGCAESVSTSTWKCATRPARVGIIAGRPQQRAAERESVSVRRLQVLRHRGWSGLPWD